MLYKVVKGLRKTSNNIFGAMALTCGLGVGVGFGTYNTIEEEWDNPEPTSAIMEQIENSQQSLTSLEALQKQFNILQQEKKLSEMKDGEWDPLSENEIQYLVDRYKLETKMEAGTDRWLMDLVKSEGIAEKDFQTLVKQLEDSSISRGSLWSRFIESNANALKELQDQYKSGGISDKEAKEILSEMSGSNPGEMNSIYAGAGASFAFLLLVWIPFLQGQGIHDFERWARRRVEKSKKKPTVKRN